jgi:hypothetical protein
MWRLILQLDSLVFSFFYLFVVVVMNHLDETSACLHVAVVGGASG